MNIFITGASSGIGAALALEYAEAGNTLHLLARNSARLEEIAKAAREKGAVVYTHIADVTDIGLMRDVVEKADKISPLDLLIANAGISAGTGIHSGESEEQVRKIFATNLDGVINTIHPIIPFMEQRGKGQIAIISSLAGIRALPSAPAYSASKAAVRYYGEALAGFLAKNGVQVSVVCPGYITTPMTAVNNYPMPFIMSAEKAAKIIASGLEKGKIRIAFPLALYIPLWLISCLPSWLTQPLFSHLPAKPAIE